MSGRYDAVVVGGRVAGASNALLLARAGARVALLERSPRGSDTLSTHALMRGGVLQLSRWGLLPDLLRAGTPSIRRTLFHYIGDPPVQVSIRRSPGVDALYAPRRHVLDTLLVDAAAAAGVHVQGGVTTGLLNALVAENLPGSGSVFLQVSWRFLAPVRPGDVLTAEARVLEVRADKPVTTLETTVRTGDGTVVIDGTAVVWRDPVVAARSIS